MIDPLSRLRGGIDQRFAVQVTTKLGAVLSILPIMVTPRDILAGRVPRWHIDAIILRDAWAHADLFKTEPTFPPVIIGTVCMGAVQTSYDITDNETREWFNDDDGEAVLRVCSAACGRSNGDRALAQMRKRAFNASLIGLGDSPLTPIELAFASDWSVNSQAAPKGM
jgi:hypothetical protein